MRILLVSHPPLTAELGAAQIALNLAAALRERGHDATAWSPEPLPADTRWWNLWRRQRRAIAEHAARHGPFDAIDTPAISAGRALGRSGPLVVRSIQPELLYLFQDVAGDLRRHLSPRAFAHALLAAPRAAAILGGWRRARLILCMGSLELAWMRRRFPGWAGKLGVYDCSPTAAEQTALVAVRRRRTEELPRSAVRFLWLGRWAAHKGIDRLLAFLARRLPAAPGDTVTLAGCGAAAAPAIENGMPREWLDAGRVRLLPAFGRGELPSLLAAHDAGLFTSHVEGWGLSLNEMLESGLPVFATEAGAAADLRPFFPHRLLPFPPPDALPASLPLEDLEANGYHRRFTWPAIARAYEQQVLASCV